MAIADSPQSTILHYWDLVPITMVEDKSIIFISAMSHRRVGLCLIMR